MWASATLMGCDEVTPRQRVSGLRTWRQVWLGQVVLRWRLWPSVRVSKLGWGVGAGVCICGRHRAYVQHVRTRFSQAGRGTYGHCANRLDSGWRHGMLQGFDILYGYGARVQEGLRGQLHGGRPHVLWRMRATGGMESEPTKLRCTS